jgi:hypothetical protein
MLTEVEFVSNMAATAISVLVIGVLVYCQCLLKKAFVVPVNKYGNDKIILALLWIFILILIS